MRRLVDVLGHPETAVAGHPRHRHQRQDLDGPLPDAPCSTAKGLRVGTFTSPHLERINERLAADGEPISDADLAEVLDRPGRASSRLLGDGRPAHLVRDPDRRRPAVVRGPARRRGRLRGRPRRPLGRHQRGRCRRGGGDQHRARPHRVPRADPGRRRRREGRHRQAGRHSGPRRARIPSCCPSSSAKAPSALWWAGRDYDCSRNDLAVGGRVLDLRTPQATYEDVWLDLHGSYQGDNFAAALAAAEAFFGAPLDDRLVREAAATVRSPGPAGDRRPRPAGRARRGQEPGRRPPGRGGGSRGVRRPLADPGGRHAAGQGPGSDVASPRRRPVPPGGGLPPALAAGPARRRGCGRRRSHRGRGRGGRSVPEALEVAFDRAGPDDLILVTGSLYVVGRGPGRLWPSRHLIAAAAAATLLRS